MSGESQMRTYGFSDSSTRDDLLALAVTAASFLASLLRP